MPDFERDPHSEKSDRGSSFRTANANELALPAVRAAGLAAVVGCVSGLGGLALALILHSVQHFAYGYSLDAVVGSESYLQGVSDASGVRRFAVLLVCGLVAGFGWYCLARFGRRLVTVGAAVGPDTTRMPFVETIIHSLLQMVTVALGSPLGREVAPREWGALTAQRIAELAKLSPDDARVLIACGAGGGLAAVYDVPAAGAVFVMEVLLRRVNPRIFLSAAISCMIAAWIARIELGPDLQYSIPLHPVDTGLMLWAVLIGAPFGAAGYAFAQWTSKCALKAAKGSSRIWKSILSFTIVGGLSTMLPQLLGNGKGPAELAFSDGLPIGLAATLIVAKILCVTLVLRSGAKGGLLTPGFALGALSAVFFGGIFQSWLPFTSTGSIAVVGAAAFLSASMAMPITAIFLTIEFMDAPITFVLPRRCLGRRSRAAC